MGRARNPLSNRNRNASFTGAEVARALERLAASKKARVVRERSEFDLRDLRSILKAPFVPASAYSWSMQEIVEARDQQMVGRFRQPARLAESMGTNPAIFTARSLRLATVQSLGVEILPGPGAKGDSIAAEAKALFGANGIAVSSETITSIRANLADHGVAFGKLDWMSRADGSRIDVVLNAWPIEFVWWHTIQGCYYTQVRHLDEEPPDPPTGGLYMPSVATGFMPLEPIIHGNGRWVVFAKSEILPHRLDAAILPGSLVWASNAFASRDWNKGSATHGNAKVVGELPADVALNDPAGNLTQEAIKFLDLVQGVASMESPVGIRPAGSKIDYITNPSKAWEVWSELALASEKHAARIYLGTDGILGAQGGAPGIDVQALLGVATSKIQSDLTAIEKGLQTGVIAPWAAINFGDDTRAPLRQYVFPDPDESAVREDFAKRNAAFLDEMQKYRTCGFVVDQALVNKIAAAHGVPAPTLAISQPNGET